MNYFGDEIAHLHPHPWAVWDLFTDTALGQGWGWIYPQGFGTRKGGIGVSFNRICAELFSSVPVYLLEPGDDYILL